jgi:predicted short-subunit dehydrogenase-like oxidoreductase (DUF2520 family)
MGAACYSAFVRAGMRAGKRISFIGAGALARGLAKRLHEAGYSIGEIVARNQPASLGKARALARAVGAQAVTLACARLDCDLLWLAVPDAAIEQSSAELAEEIARRQGGAAPRVALHASGALSSQALSSLAKLGIATGSAHPMMTFVAGEPPSLDGVWFAVEGSAAALRASRAMARKLRARCFAIAPESKLLYHAFGAMLSPMLASELEAAGRTGVRAGIDPRQVRRIMEPIVLRTVRNVLLRGAENSFSGPLARGDAGTIAGHLQALRGLPEGEVYRALALYATRTLPVKRAAAMKKLLR